MAVFIYLASPEDLEKPIPDAPTLLLGSSPEYWFLYRYFEAANLDRRHELIDLYGGGPIEGYQLHRLRVELEQAQSDIEAKPEAWDVLVGWKGEVASRETEDWRSVDKSSVGAIVRGMLDMIQRAEEHNVKLVTSGD